MGGQEEECGESREDEADLDLPGYQEDLALILEKIGN
jgi:hypothetical protein